MIKRWGIFTAFALFITLSVHAEEKLFWHPVRLDKDGKLLAWSETASPYHEVVRRAWNAFKEIPVQPNGYKTYFAYPVFYGPKDTGQELFAGRDWSHNPGGLFAMLTDAAILYYPYSGDEDIMPLIRTMLDHSIARGSTQNTDAWSLVPYASTDGGSLDYRGANEARYVQTEAYLGRGDGIGFIEPDKVGELGLAYLRFYQFSLEEKYCAAAQHCADALAKHVRTGDESHSPWPFRVDALTGTKMREEYTSNTVGPIRLLDEIIRLNRGKVADYQRARDIAFQWMMKYPMQNQIWTQYFEDIYIYPDYRTNLNHYCPLETARYLMEHPEYDPQWKIDVKRIIEWVRGFFAADSKTMAGLPEKGVQWGAEVISEQVNDMDKMTSHTARYASVMALWYERTGDQDAKKKAFRSFNWASYGCKEDGLVKTSLDEGTGYWFSDGYGDYMRHFLRGMASVPQWAPPDENHMLRSSSVVRKIQYGKDTITYTTFDEKSAELFKLSHAPKEVSVDGKKITPCDTIDDKATGYSVNPVDGGGFVLRISHVDGRDVVITLGR
jgi:hypothetical protein